MKKTVAKKKNMKRWWFRITAIVITFFIILNYVSFNVVNKVFDNVFGGDSSSGRGGNTEFVTDDGIVDKQTALEAANATNLEICEEGFVLLKNEDHMLPVETAEDHKTKVSVFGKNSVNLVYSGSGSGSGDSSSARTIYESLAEAGYDYNETLKEFYESKDSGDGRPASLAIEAGIPTGFATGETPVAGYPEDVKDSFAEYGDLAVVVISRTNGEGNDVPTTMKNTDGAVSEKDHYLELDQNEQDMLQMVCENFDRVVLVINSSQTMELGFLDDVDDGDETQNPYDYASGIDAALWIGSPGGSGIMALGEILNGSVNPSGRTVDTYARDFTTIPAYENLCFKSDEGTTDTYLVNGKAQEQFFSDYEEGIYVGYRYFETRAAIEANNGNGDWYSRNVVYPFGYGLSYTTFQWNLEEKALPKGEIDKDSSITISVEVENTGDYAGKDVVELYVRTPYYDGQIEKADKVLCAFAKTELIEPNKKDSVEMTIDPYSFASYDYNDANGNGFTGYELEAGEYEFLISRNANESVLSFTMNVPETIFYETSITGETVGNLYDDASEQLGSVLSRTDFEGTWPQKRTEEEKSVDEAFIAQVKSTETNNPLTAESDAVKNADLTVATKKSKDGIQLFELKGLPYDDPKWGELLNKMTVSSMHNFRQLAAFGTEAIDYISKPKTVEPDGPAGFTQFMGGSEVYDTCLYASECVIGSTWNVELAKRMGISIGNESIIGDGNDPYSGWYAPGVNIHRTPFGGRNSEYYSEDSLLSGQMAAGVIEGAAEKGVYCYMKHFVANENETHRNGVCVWLTEQALREIYLKSFELAVTKSNGTANAVMSSFNRIGTQWTGGDYRLLTQILRNEWGFVGAVICDFSVGQAYMDSKQMAYAGGDVNLTNMDMKWVDADNPLDIYILKQCVKNALYIIANSNAMNGLGEDIVYETSFALWKKVIILVDAIVAVGLLVWGIVIWLPRKKEK